MDNFTQLSDPELNLPLGSRSACLINNLTIAMTSRTLSYASAQRASISIGVCNINSNSRDLSSACCHTRKIQCSNNIANCKFVTIKNQLLISLENGELLVYDSVGNEQLGSYKASNDTPFMCVCSNDNFIFAGRYNGDIFVFNNLLQKPKALMCHEVAVMDMAANNKNLVSGDLSGTIVVWDTINHNQICVFKNDNAAITSLRWWGIKIISAYADGKIRIHNLETGNLETEFTSHRRAITALDVNENQLVSVSEDSYANVFELADCGDRNDVTCSYSYQWPDRLLCGVQFFKNNLLISAYDANTVQIIPVKAEIISKNSLA